MCFSSTYRKHSVIQTLVQRLIKNAEYFAQSGEIRVENTVVLSLATFLINLLCGSETLSSFEVAMGYTPSLAGLPQQNVAGELPGAHQQQDACRALQKLKNSRSPRLLRSKLFEKNNAVSYFKRGLHFGTWQLGFVRRALAHFVVLSSNPNHRGKPIRAET